MNYNIQTYSIYLPIICFILIHIGWKLNKHGKIFLMHIFNQDESLVNSINNILLIGYYLINLGYAIITIFGWEKIDSVPAMFGSLSFTLGKIILLLAVMHYNNVACLSYFVKSKSKNQ